MIFTKVTCSCVLSITIEAPSCVLSITIVLSITKIIDFHKSQEPCQGAASVEEERRRLRNAAQRMRSPALAAAFRAWIRMCDAAAAEAAKERAAHETAKARKAAAEAQKKAATAASEAAAKTKEAAAATADAAKEKAAAAHRAAAQAAEIKTTVPFPGETSGNHVDYDNS